MRDATFACPDLSTFCRLDELGLVVTGQRLEPDRAVLACRVREADDWCHRCGEQGVARDTVVRRLAHEPFGWRPTILLVTVRPRVAPGHHGSGAAAGEDLPGRASVGAEGPGCGAPERGAGR